MPHFFGKISNERLGALLEKIWNVCGLLGFNTVLYPGLPSHNPNALLQGHDYMRHLPSGDAVYQVLGPGLNPVPSAQQTNALLQHEANIALQYHQYRHHLPSGVYKCCCIKSSVQTQYWTRDLPLTRRALYYVATTTRRHLPRGV